MRNILNKIKDMLFLFNPEWLFMNYSYSKEWDIKLNNLMDTDKFIGHDGYLTQIGGYELWIANYPYAAFHYNGVRPSRKTIRRAKKRMKMDTMPLPDVRNEKINEILDIG